jgi:hypothetical protein
MFQIKEPGFYRDRRGQKMEVIAVLPKECKATDFHLHGSDHTWTRQGKAFLGNKQDPYDLIAKWEEPQEELYEWAYKDRHNHWRIDGRISTENEARHKMTAECYIEIHRLRKFPNGACECNSSK